MNNMVVGMVIAMGSAGALYADLPEKVKSMYEESVNAAQQVSTAGDLHTMSVLLDAVWIMDRALPTEEEFPAWLNDHLKENNVKELDEDHWGNPYIYVSLDNGRGYQLRSVGPDGVEGTDDDMVKTGP